MLRSIKLQLDSHRLRYMNQHQYGQANSRFLISYSFWLDTPNTYFNIYLHTSSLIKSMQSDFPNLYLYNETNIETHLYLIWVVSFVIWPMLDISSLMHSWFILQSLIKANSLSNSSCSCKASHYWDQSKIINSCLIYHLLNMLAFSWYYDIQQYRSHFISSICIVVFFLNYIVSMIFQRNNTQFWLWFEHYVEYHQVCHLVEPIYTSHSTIHMCMQ